MVYPRPWTITWIFLAPAFWGRLIDASSFRGIVLGISIAIHDLRWPHCIKICSQYFFQIIRSEYQKRAILILSFTKTILEFTPTNFAHEIPTTGLPNFTFQIINDLVYHVHVLLLPTGDPTSLTFKKKQRKKPQSCNFGQNPLMETWDVRGLGIATSEISDELFVGPKASVPGRVGSPPANNMDISKNTYSPLRWTRNNKKWQTIYHNAFLVLLFWVQSKAGLQHWSGNSKGAVWRFAGILQTNVFD